jgi:hypothetical protein
VTITPEMVKHLDTLATEIMGNYRPARHQLEEWTATHKSAVIGASPPEGHHDIDPEEAVHLTTVERQALSYDRAGVMLDRLHHSLATVAHKGRDVWATVDGTAIPEPAPTDAALLAVMMWATRRADRDRNLMTDTKIDGLRVTMVHLAGLCAIHLPPPPTKIVDCCHAHSAAGLEAEVDPRYRRLHLCDWCYRFRLVHHVNPPPRLVKLHDRGIKMSATILRREGIVTNA